MTTLINFLARRTAAIKAERELRAEWEAEEELHHKLALVYYEFEDRVEMTRYPQDRASVLATTISILVRRLHAPEVHAEIAQTLREEFHDIARQARDETRPSGE